MRQKDGAVSIQYSCQVESVVRNKVEQRSTRIDEKLFHSPREPGIFL